MSKITNRFVHFKTKASFTSRLGAGDIQESSVVFIQDANEIWTHGTYYKCDISEAEVIALINSKGYITEADIPSLTGGAAATSGQYVSGVTVSGHNVTVTKAALPTSVSGNAGTATKLATPRVIAIAGAVSGSATFDGSSNVSINSTLNGFDASKITSGTISEARLPNIPIEKLPAGALERMFVVESQTAAIDAVKAGTIQEGDVVQIGNGGLMYFCIDDAATTFGNAFKEFTAGSATSVPWSGVTGKPSSFTPSAHNQASNTITALTGYAKSTNAAITTSDTLNTALGKLETKVDITYGWGNHASAGYAKATQLANYLPLTGGTLTGGLTANNISLFDSGKTNDYNVTAKIGDPSTYSTPVRFAPSSAHGHYAIQFSDADSVLFGKIGGKFVKIISDVNKAEVVADSFYMGGNLVATQSWVTGKGYLTSVPAQTWASITGKPSTFTPSAHTQSYTTLTGSTTTANQAIVSNGTANGWTLKTLGSLAFSSATIPTKTSQLTNDSGFLTSVPAQSWASITGKPTFATVATSGSYNDLSNKPTIPSLSGYATQSWVTSQGYLTSIPVATSSAYGGIQIGYTTSGKNYAVQLSNGKAYVNVPWTDTNINYYPTTFTWANGTTAGPTGSLTGSGMSTVSFGAIPSASATQSGVVTTGDQTFGGIKTIDTINVTNINEATPGEGFWIGYNTEGVIRIGKDGDYDFGTSGGTYSGTANTAKRLLNSLQFSNGQSFNGSSAVTIDLPEIPIALPNPYALTINGTSYTGSSAVSISTSKPLSVRMLTSSTVDAGYSYSCGTSKAISTLNGFSSTNPDSVIISSAKLTFTASNVIKMDGLDDLSGTYYIYCLSYMANGKIAVNGAVYA